MIQVELKANQQAEPKTYKVGDTFKNVANNTAYILISLKAYVVVLYCIDSTLKYTLPFDVNDETKITSSEFDKITNGKSKDFIPTDFKLIEL